ncbi:MFS transporter [Aerococcaceae bacterium WGS1372]
MKERKVFYGWWVVVGIVINLSLLGPAAVAIANLFQTAVTTEFGISNSAFAINNVLVLGIGIFISPIVSRLLSGDKFKLTYLAGVLSYIIGLVGYSFSQNIYNFYFFSLFLGTGFITSTIIPASILINNWFIDKRGLALSIALSGLGIGGFILSPLVTALISSLEWRMTYQIYAGLIAVLVIPTSLFLIRFKPEDMELVALESENIDETATNSSSQVDSGKVRLTVSQSLKKPFSSY